MALFLENLSETSQLYSLKILGSGNNLIEGVYTSHDFNVAGGNEFDTRAGQGAGSFNVLDSATGLASKLTQAGAATTGAGVLAIPQFMTQKVWKGSQAPSFTVNVLFLCLKADDAKQKVTTKVNSIMEYLYPRKLDGGILSAPKGYNPGSNGILGKGKVARTGVVTLQLGRWFSASSLVIDNASFEYSKELNRFGEPIYAQGTVTLSPIEVITFKQFKRYFRGS